MAEASSGRTRGNSKPNVKRRGSTYTYYVYVTDADGRRRQHSKGGFRTRGTPRRHASRRSARSRTAAYVKPERVDASEVPEDEWLPRAGRRPSRRAPTARTSRYVRLHVVPYIGGIPLQKLTPVDLNRLYRQLLESGRRPPAPTDSAPARGVRPSRRAAGEWPQLRRGRRDSSDRSSPASASSRGTPSPRSIRRGRPKAVGDASRRRAVGADGALHPHDHPCRPEGRHAVEPSGPQRRRRRHSPIRRRRLARQRPKAWTADQLRRVPRLRRRRAATCRRGSSSPPPDAGAASASACDGTTSTSTRAPR